jgi:RNA recognition motif-containing protein
MKLLIRNIARTTTEASLRTLFESRGTVQSCNLVMDKATGASKGFGFVEMPKPGEAKAAMKILNGRELDGSKIRVKKAEEKLDDKKQMAPVPVTEESVWRR